jgi:hypothetical protein
VAQKTADDRVRERIRLRLQELRRHHPFGGKNQEGLAKILEVKPSSISEMLKLKATRKERGLLTHLDDIAKYLDVPPSFFVVKNEKAVVELQDEEPQLIAHWRRLPKGIQRQVMDVLTFVAGLLPEEREQRRWWVKIRRIADPARRAEIEQLIDDILQKQRPATWTRNGSAAQDSSPAKAPATHLKTKH